MVPVKVLVVDDDASLRLSIVRILTKRGFDVTESGSVPDALKHIASMSFDVLLSDLHLPGAGDGLTLVSAMKHINPKAVTLLLSGFPQMEAATQAILLQADEVLVKPLGAMELIETIERRLAAGPRSQRVTESIESILLRCTGLITEKWLQRVHDDKKIMGVAQPDTLRCLHLPQVLLDIRNRLHAFQPLGTTKLLSSIAADHGKSRREQGYTAAMMVEESRALQVTIFETLQENLACIDFSQLLLAVMTIADEVDSQLSQAMSSYIAESVVDFLPA